jgi:acetyl-CoA carboxylase carboxyl transferase subunit beta
MTDRNDPRRAKSENVLEAPVTQVPVEVPERTLLVRCPSCRRVVDAQLIADNLDVCPRCGHHLRIGARRRLSITVDAGSFEEWDAGLAATDFLDFPGYPDKLDRARRASGETDAVVCGRATIGGQPCALFVMDGSFMMGSMGAVVGEKICRCFERATEEGLPVVGFTISGGARMQEGTTSLMQMAKVSGAIRKHSEAALAYLVVLCDPTSGGVTASFAMDADVCLAEPGALVAFAGPRVVEQTTHKRLPAGFQRAEFLLDHGFVDRIVPRGELGPVLAELLALHAGQAPDASAPDVCFVNRASARRERAHMAEVARADHGLERSAARVVREVARAVRRTTGVGDDDDQDAEPAPEAPEPYEVVKSARSTTRATAADLIERTFDGFVELHGDRLFGEDAAVVGGIAWKDGTVVTVIATERGRSTKERIERNFGSAHPEGYRKALRLMRQAERFGRPVVCLVDTAGAYCGIGAEERGQGSAIAQNLMTMSGLTVPLVTCVIGEGGSGGALALAVADRVLMLSGAVYSVVSPEGCASILWKTADRAADAADALGLTAPDLMRLGVIDGIVDEAGLDFGELARSLWKRVSAELEGLSKLSPSDLVEARYQRFRAIGGDHICSGS